MLHRAAPRPWRPTAFMAACATTFATLAITLTTMLAPFTPAQASERDATRVPAPAAYQQECAACHVAFPASGLPAASWQRLMGRLSQHFGSDASLDPATTAEIARYLQANAATGRRAQDTPAEDRLTRSAWFTREHDEISPAVWKRAAIGKPSNCAACHQGAPQGRFSEHDVRIPK